MNLKELANAAHTKRPNHSILLYGEPKTGKTGLVGTAAKIPELKRIFWFDLENGIETLMHMGLTDPEQEKITAFQIADSREKPLAAETILRVFSSSSPITICDTHGRANCVECQDKASKKFTGTEFCLASCTHDDLIVIDTGSQLGDSTMNLACLGKPVTYKPGWDEYAIQGKYLGDILSVIQTAFFTNFVVICHSIPIEEELNGIKRDKLYPLMGSKAFCTKVGKYFGTVVYVEKKLGKHVAGSGSLYRADTIVGSRVNARVEDGKNGPDMRAILIEGGILK